MSEQARRRRMPDDPMVAHLDRVYVRLDELSSRMRNLELKVYAMGGGLGVIATLNLAANIAQSAGQ